MLCEIAAESDSRMRIASSRSLLLNIPGESSFLTTHLQLPLGEPRRLSERGSRIASGLDYGIPTTAATGRVVIRSVAFPCPARSSRPCFGAFAAPGVCEASALLSHPSGSGSPVPVPPEKQLLVLGAAPPRFRVPETTGRTRRNVCTSIESPLSVSSAATPKERLPTQRHPLQRRPCSRRGRTPQPRIPARTRRPAHRRLPTPSESGKSVSTPS